MALGIINRRNKRDHPFLGSRVAVNPGTAEGSGGLVAGGGGSEVGGEWGDGVEECGDDSGYFGGVGAAGVGADASGVDGGGVVFAAR